MDRREFVKTALQAALTTMAWGALPVVDLAALPTASGVETTLALRKGTDIPRLVHDALQALGGMSGVVRRGDVVVVKPNIGWDRTPELAANTHPLVVRSVVEQCLEAGAGKVLVFDNTCNDARRCYVQSGIQGALDSLGSDRVRLEHIDRRAFQEVDIKGGVALQRWPFYRPALEADRFINVPVAKHHSISRLTLGLKNMMGVIGGNRGVLHRHIDESLADINSVVHSDLTVIDATRMLMANGPQGGRLEDVQQANTLIASTDIVAADSCAATLFGLKPTDLPMLATAARRGLGVADLSRVRQV